MNEVILLIIIAIGCIGVDVYWYWLIRHIKCRIFTAFSHLLCLETCAYIVGVSVATNKAINTIIITFLLGVLALSAFSLGRKLDDLSDDAVALMPKEGEAAEKLDAKRRLAVTVSVFWMAFLIIAISVYTLIIMADDDLLHLLANCTILIGIGLIFALVYGCYHNEISIVERDEAVLAKYQPKKPKYEIPAPYNNPYRIPLA